MEELLRRVSSRELTEWSVFEAEHGPLGPGRGDWQAAMVAYTVAAVAGGRGKESKITDYLLKWSKRKGRQTAQEQLAIFKALASKGAVDSGNDS